MIKTLKVEGFRGFSERTEISFALPDNKNPGSGLTIITGANNSGKTSIIESIQAFIGYGSPTFSEGRRNLNCDGRVFLELTDDKNNTCTIKTSKEGGSTTKKSLLFFKITCDVIPSRRSIPLDFGMDRSDKASYLDVANALPLQRRSDYSHFTTRIFQIRKHKENFDKIIRSILHSDFQWMIEQRDSGQYYLKYSQNGYSHSAEGIGDGMWSLFTICAAFCDSDPESKETVIIDEPELSVHPSIQKRLMDFFVEESKDRQIIINTHSPYFIRWSAIANKAALLRVVKENGSIMCYSISDEFRNLFGKQLNNINNPHLFGLDASEVVFCEDRIILTEGQEDVVIYKKIAESMKLSFCGNFFGWGAGGAANMKLFLTLFKDLGFKHVVALLDGDKKEEAEKLKQAFPEYCIMTLITDDIRDKPSRSLPEKSGIATEGAKIKEDYIDYFNSLVKKINSALNGK